MHTGTVKWYAFAKGTGFITDDDGTEVALVKKQILDQDRFLGEGQRVSFDVVSYNGKLAAVRVKPLRSDQMLCPAPPSDHEALMPA